MNGKDYLRVTGSGVLSAIGNNADFLRCAVRAGISGAADSQIYGKESLPLRMALVPAGAMAPLDDAITPLNYKERRLLTLATPALQQACKDTFFSQPPPLFIAIPESIPRCPSMVSESFIDKLCTNTKTHLDVASSRVIPSGRAGGLQAVFYAFKYLLSGTGSSALVGGVDTCLDLRKTAFLNAENRLTLRGVTDTFIPGEAACFLLLERSTNDNLDYPFVSMPGFSSDSGHRYSNENHTGEALSLAFADALKHRREGQVQRIYSSLNGEHYFAKEYGVARTRNSKYFSDSIDHLHPIENFGDVGAALGCLMIVLASAVSGTSLVYSSSDTGLCSAICVN